MKSLSKISLSLLCTLQFVACGSSHSDNNEPAPPTDIGLVDPNAPVAVDLEHHVVFDDHVSDNAKTNLTKDMTLVQRADLTTGTDNDDALKSLLQVADLGAGSVSGWLKARIHYMIGSDLSQYQIGLIVPSEKQIYTEALPADDDPEGSQNVAAVMIGTALYSFSASTHMSNPEVSYAAIHINDGWVHGNTQRNGVMQIGPALFDPNFQPSSDADAYSNSVVRISTIFHEARHADGNRLAGSLGFSHFICPKNSGVAKELVGQPACDSMANGAYTVGYRVMKAYVAKCGTQCSTRDKSVLNALLLDSLSRVVQTPGKTLPVLDATPDKGFAAVDISSFTAVVNR